MLIRIVRMTFQADKITDFLEIFNHSKEKILSMDGCTHVEVLQDTDNPLIFCTYSHWNSVEDLNNYRNSDFFVDVWRKTKALFAEKPLAFSLKKI